MPSYMTEEEADWRLELQRDGWFQDDFDGADEGEDGSIGLTKRAMRESSNQ